MWSAFSQSCQATNPSARIGNAVTSAVMNRSSDSLATGSTSSRLGTTSAAADTQILLGRRVGAQAPRRTTGGSLSRETGSATPRSGHSQVLFRFGAGSRPDAWFCAPPAESRHPRGAVSQPAAERGAAGQDALRQPRERRRDRRALAALAGAASQQRGPGAGSRERRGALVLPRPGYVASRDDPVRRQRPLDQLEHRRVVAERGGVGADPA